MKPVDFSSLEKTLGEQQDLKKQIRQWLRDDDNAVQVDQTDFMKALDQDPEHFLMVMNQSKTKKTEKERLQDLKTKLWSIL